MVAAALSTAAPARAEDPAQSAEACWTPNALRAAPDERRIRRHHDVSIPPAGSGLGLVPVEAKPIGAIRRVELPPGVKLVALTFDLCEAEFEIAGYQGAIVDYLRRDDIAATFFAGGKWIQSHPERVQQLMADPLFEIANHGWAHRNLRGLSGSALHDEIRYPQIAYREARAKLAARQCLARNGARADDVAAPQPTLFRFPYGACNPQSLRAVADEGLLPIQWDVSTGDATQSVKAILGDVAHTQPGSIVLMHANGRGENTEAALPRIVALLKKRGYRFVTVSQLLAAGKPVVTPACYDLKPGDTDRYDVLFHLQGAAVPLPIPAEVRRR